MQHMSDTHKYAHIKKKIENIWLMVCLNVVTMHCHMNLVGWHLKWIKKWHLSLFFLFLSLCLILCAVLGWVVLGVTHTQKKKQRIQTKKKLFFDKTLAALMGANLTAEQFLNVDNTALGQILIEEGKIHHITQNRNSHIQINKYTHTHTHTHTHIQKVFLQAIYHQHHPHTDKDHNQTLMTI